MTNNKLTDEHVAGYAKYGTGLGYDDRHIQEMARRLLTAEAGLQEYREAKPVAYTDAEELAFTHATSDMWPRPLGFGRDVPLYLGPQPLTDAERQELQEYRKMVLPVAPETVPDELRDEIIELCDGYEIGDVGAQEIWSACRAAMFATTPKTE